MAKPAGPACNLRCRYCFYTEKEALFDGAEQYRMSDEVLEAYIRKYIEAAPTQEVNFAWQGGEPTLLGVDFFRRAVELQKKYAGKKRITNSLQTNGILIDEEWGEFLARANFLIGLSIDGPQDIHDLYRVDRGENPTFEKVMKTMRILQENTVRYNTLTSVTPECAERPLEVYNFLKDTGTNFMQFIPIVERVPDEHSRELGLELAEPRPWESEDEGEVTDWTVEPEQYGDFLCEIFDEWVKNDVGETFVQIFDVSLAGWVGQDPPLCNFSEKCGNAMIIEHNGDLYSCDHFVYPGHRLGNILEDPVEEMVTGEPVRRLGEFKKEGLPQKCRDCEVLFVCHGGCPKNRFTRTEDGENGLNYLCDGYYKFFRHIDPKMKKMASLLQRGRPPAEIMEEEKPRIQKVQAVPKRSRKVGRNDPCPCGSGKKYKNCCGRRR